jgi:threonine dehydrogenase-like Zn-dependent dehydrogenase
VRSHKQFQASDFAGGFDGGQAEYVRCPIANVNLLKILNSFPDEKASYLSDIIPNSYHCTVCADVKKSKSVAVWGPDPVGLFACKWSKLAEARRAIAIDRVPARLALAKKMGCDVINFGEQSDVVNEIYKLEAEGVDCSIDAAAFRYTK